VRALPVAIAAATRSTDVCARARRTGGAVLGGGGAGWWELPPIHLRRSGGPRWFRRSPDRSARRPPRSRPRRCSFGRVPSTLPDEEHRAEDRAGGEADGLGETGTRVAQKTRGSCAPCAATDAGRGVAVVAAPGMKWPWRRSRRFRRPGSPALGQITGDWGGRRRALRLERRSPTRGSDLTGAVHGRSSSSRVPGALLVSPLRWRFAQAIHPRASCRSGG